ncbi:hypothetical protein [Thalassotalea ganghwensis]
MSTFTEKANVLLKNKGALAAVASIAVLASNNASANIIDNSELILESSYTGFWNVSGQFTGVFNQLPTSDNFDPQTRGQGSGNIYSDSLGKGLKLYGDASMTGEDVNGWGDGIQGLAFLWTGRFTHDLNAGDQLNFDFEFELETNGAAVDWQVVSYIAPWSSTADLWEQTLGTSADTSSFSSDGNAHTGTVSGSGNWLTGQSFSNAVDSDGEYFWSVALTASWSNYSGENAVTDADFFSVNIPDHSIDVGINQVPTAEPIAVSETGSMALLLAGLSGLAFSRRKVTK